MIVNVSGSFPLEISVTAIEWQSPGPLWPIEPLWQPWLIKDLSYIKLQNLHCLLGLVHYGFGDDESDCIVLLSLMIEWQWTQQLTQTSVWELPYLELCSTPIGKCSASEMPGWSRSPETKAVFDIIWWCVHYVFFFCYMWLATKHKQIFFKLFSHRHWRLHFWLGGNVTRKSHQNLTLLTCFLDKLCWEANTFWI